MNRNEFLTIRDEIIKLKTQEEKIRAKFKDLLQYTEEQLGRELNDALDDIHKKEHKYRERLQVWYRNLSEKSTFEIETIGKAIAALLSITEDDEYACCKIVIKRTGYEDREPWTKYVDAQVVIKSQYKDCNTAENSFDCLTNDSKACLVLNESTPVNIINFNEWDAKDLYSPIKPFWYRNFKLVEQFMNELIDYRIDNNMKTINKKQIFDFLKIFTVGAIKQKHDTNMREIEQESKNSEEAYQSRLALVLRNNMKMLEKKRKFLD